MQVFFKKTWGYGPYDWPMLGFSTKGGLNKLEREYRPGDWIVIAGTNAFPTSEEDQGRLLGMVQITNMIVELEHILGELGTKLTPDAYNEAGDFRWPHGFPYLEGRTFIGKPLIKDVFPDRRTDLGQAEAAYALALDEKEISLVMALPTTDDEIRIIPSLKPHKRLADLLGGTNPGPVPVMGDRTSSYEDGENSVYVFRIKGTNFFKIGRTNNIERRLAEFNSAPHAIWSGKLMELVNSHPFDNANSAHEVEQLLHKRLEKFSKGNECFEASEKHIVPALGSVVYEYSQQLS